MSSPLETQLGHELRQLVSGHPSTLDLDAIEQRARQRHRRGVALRGVTAAGAAVVVAGGLFTAVHGTGGTAGPGTAAAPAKANGKSSSGAAASPAPGTNSQLMSLAANITASSDSQPGDASLVITTKKNNGKLMETDYLIYADNGKIYSAQSVSGLPAAVAHNQTIDYGVEAQEIAAAVYAAKGDLATARQKMVDSTGDDINLNATPAQRKAAWEKDKANIDALYKAKGVKPPTQPPTDQQFEETANNHIWAFSTDALTFGGGNPEIRAGVLRLLATIPEVKVTNSTTNGQATLTLTAGSALFDGTSPEVLTIDAKTGTPVELTSAAGDGVASATETYKVSRVTLAAVEKGKF